MSEIDVTAYWSSECEHTPQRFRLRINREDEFVFALLSETENDLAKREASSDVETILDREFHLAATAAARTFNLNLLDTVWLREVRRPDRSGIHRVVMDEEEGRFVNARYGALTTFDNLVLKQKRMLAQAPKNAKSRFQFSLFDSLSRVSTLGWVGAMAVIVIGSGWLITQERRHSAEMMAQLEQKQTQLEEASRQILAMDLIEKERQLATAANSTVRRVYRDSATMAAGKQIFEQQKDRVTTAASLLSEKLFGLKPLPLPAEPPKSTASIQPTDLSQVPLDPLPKP